MDLVDDDAHRALTYIAAVTSAGGSLDERQIEEYVSRPTRKKSRRSGGGGVAGVSAALQSLVDAYFGEGEVIPGETWVDYLNRLGWATRTFAGVHLTQLGEAVLRHTNRPVDDSEDAALTVEIDPADPIAYARVFAAIGNAGSGLLVDPYLKLDQLTDLRGFPNVSKILTSDDKRNKRAGEFGLALRQFAEPPEIRFLPLKDVHDRYFISDKGPILSLASSLNSIASRPGVIVPLATSLHSHVRRTYNKLWLRAELFIADANGLPVSLVERPSPTEESSA